MIGRGHLPWLLFAVALVLIHETSWSTAPYWLPWFKRAVAAIGNPLLPVIVVLGIAGLESFYELYDSERNMVHSS